MRVRGMVSSRMRARKRKSSFFERFLQVSELGPNLQSVGAKPLALDQTRQVVERHEFAAADFFALEVKGAIMRDVIHHAARDRVFADIMKIEERNRPHSDA